MNEPQRYGDTNAALTNLTVKESKVADVNHRICTVYGLCSESDESIRYVGQTTVDIERRLRQHIKHSRTAPKPVYRDNWINSVIRNGGSIKVVVLQYGATWNVSERYWIAKLKSEGAKLVNSTSGGEGSLDAPEELMEKIRASVKMLWKDSGYRAKAAGSRVGVPWSDAQRAARFSVSQEVRIERASAGRSRMSQERRSEISSLAAKASWEKKRLEGTDCGVHANNAKLDDDKVREIRSRNKSGDSVKDLAREFEMSVSGIHKVLRNQTWKHALRNRRDGHGQA